MPHKYAMGIIGNGSWLALINNFGNVTWLCWPHFDSSFLFGNLLDPKNGGDYEIIPQSGIINTSQQYLDDTGDEYAVTSKQYVVFNPENIKPA
jgi:GH15 family glucan-1,4-alpha-glucosidase